ncbi:hypothetical protein F2Q69_00055002 [Brassica cretica]|uniref:Uncharacterized protein n=1 Tax=Brassica cretica TaxID=69181 RepID=A0A8S9N0R2_BRACR|nr:hypothetical protein F2Q69_00055002 [Brassica cretica]
MLVDTMQVCKSFNSLGFNGMANAGAVSRSCWPELINTVFFVANATFFHRADGGCAQAIGVVVYTESCFSVSDWLSMSSQVSCLGR